MSRITCDRCFKSQPDVAGVYPFTYNPPYDPKGADWSKHGGVRNLCEDCYEYITDAMANIWPDAPDVPLVWKSE